MGTCIPENAMGHELKTYCPHQIFCVLQYCCCTCQPDGVTITKQLQLLISQNHASLHLRDAITLDMLTSHGPASAGPNLSICKMC
jgi:hypothetical protein